VYYLHAIASGIFAATVVCVDDKVLC